MQEEKNRNKILMEDFKTLSGPNRKQKWTGRNVNNVI